VWSWRDGLEESHNDTVGFAAQGKAIPCHVPKIELVVGLIILEGVIII